MAIFTLKDIINKTGAEPKEIKTVSPKDLQPESEQSVASETFQDIKQVGSGIATDVNKRLENIDEIRAAKESGSQGAIRSTLQAMGQSYGLGADVINNLIKGVIKVALPQSGENLIKETIATPVEAVANTETVQNLIKGYSSFKENNPELARDLDAALGLTDLVTNFVGGATGAKVAGKSVARGANVVGETVNTVAKTGVNALDTVAEKVVPKLLTYTADTPEAAAKFLAERRPQVESALKSGITAEKTLSNTRGAVRTFRKTLSKEWEDSKGEIIKQFDKVRMGFGDNTIAKIEKIADEFAIDLPQNLKNLSANESIDLLTKINSLPDSILSVSPKGALVREVKKSVQDLAIKSFGGKQGSFAKLYSNYSTKKGVLDAANDIVKSFSEGKPITSATAQKRLLKIFDENNNAYLDAIVQLEKETGTDLLSNITALKYQKVLPSLSGIGSGGVAEKSLKLLLLPFTSPRASAWIQGKVKDFSGGVKSFVSEPKLGASVKSLKVKPDDIQALERIRNAYREQGAVRLGAKERTVPTLSGYDNVEQDILTNFGIPVEGKSLNSIADSIDKFLEKVRQAKNK